MRSGLLQTTMIRICFFRESWSYYCGTLTAHHTPILGSRKELHKLHRSFINVNVCYFSGARCQLMQAMPHLILFFFCPALNLCQNFPTRLYIHHLQSTLATFLSILCGSIAKEDFVQYFTTMMGQFVMICKHVPIPAAQLTVLKAQPASASTPTHSQFVHSYVWAYDTSLCGSDMLADKMGDATTCVQYSARDYCEYRTLK